MWIGREAAGLPAGVAEGLGEGGQLVVEEAGLAVGGVPGREGAGEEGRVGRQGPGRRGRGVHEDQAFLGELVEDRRGLALVAVGRGALGPDGVHDDEEHVGRTLGGGRGTLAHGQGRPGRVDDLRDGEGDDRDADTQADDGGGQALPDGPSDEEDDQGCDGRGDPHGELAGVDRDPTLDGDEADGHADGVQVLALGRQQQRAGHHADQEAQHELHGDGLCREAGDGRLAEGDDEGDALDQVHQGSSDGPADAAAQGANDEGVGRSHGSPRGWAANEVGAVVCGRRLACWPGGRPPCTGSANKGRSLGAAPQRAQRTSTSSVDAVFTVPTSSAE